MPKGLHWLPRGSVAMQLSLCLLPLQKLRYFFFIFCILIASPLGFLNLNCRFLVLQWQSVERLGATVVLIGDSYDEAQAYAKKRAKEESRTFIPPFDHPDVIIGQGTVGMEIVRQMQGPLHAIFVPVGGGGLVAGIAAYVKRVSPEVCLLLNISIS